MHWGLPGQTTAAMRRDMRSFTTLRRYNLVLVTRECFQLATVALRRRAMRCLARALARDGSLLIDLATIPREPSAASPAPTDYYDPELPDGQHFHEWTRRHQSGAVIARGREQRHSRAGVQITFHYRIVRDGPGVVEFSSTVALARICLREITMLAHAAGLRITNVFSDYQRLAYRPEGPRLICLLQHAV